jgi:hypothetical protein
MTTKTKTRKANGGPGLARLSKNPKAKAIRKAVVAYQAKALKEAGKAKRIAERHSTPEAIAKHNAKFAPTRHYNLTDIITVLVGENPKQQGSAARKRFALYKTGMTVEAALSAGLWAADIRHDAKKEHIKLSTKVNRAD